jgi:hypothetical protein
MTALVIAEAVAIALLGLLVAGLLRSHADILRALHDLGAGSSHDHAGHPDHLGHPGHAELPGHPGHTAQPGQVPAASTASVVSELDFPGVREGVAPPRPVEAADRVRDIAGMTPWDESAAVGVAGDESRTLVAFLSTGCGTCAGFWDELNRPGGAHLPASTRLVIVTKGEAEESLSALRRIAPRDPLVVMSSQAWADYEVPGSPYFLLVEGGRVTGEGSGSSWQQVRALLGQAADDAELRSGGPGRRRSLGRRSSGPNEIGDAAGRDRADRIDRELSAAGILPGDPSLYPDAQ